MTEPYTIEDRPNGKVHLACNGPMCMRRMQHKSREAAIEDWNNHTCPWGSGTKVAWSVTKTLVEQMWEKLDVEMNHIMGFLNSEGQWQFDPQPEPRKIRARALAECIAIFMTPFFETADDVAREAVKRHEARKKGEDYETPGLGHRRYESAALAHASKADGWYSTPGDAYTSEPSMAGAPNPRRGGRTTTAPSRAAVPPKIRLDEASQAAIRKAHSGMPQIFTVEVLAKQYGATRAEVTAILNS